MMPIQIDTLSVVLGATALSLSYVLATRQQYPDVHSHLIRSQSGEPFASLRGGHGDSHSLPDVSRTRVAAESAIVRSKLAPHGRPLHSGAADGVKTVGDLLRDAVRRQADKPFLVFPAGKSISFKQTGAAVDEIGSALVKRMGKEKWTVGILMGATADGVVANLACACYGIVSVPLDDTIAEADMVDVVNMAGMQALFVDAEHLDRVLGWSSQCLKLKTIITSGGSQSKEPGIEIITLESLRAEGSKSLLPRPECKADDVITLNPVVRRPASTSTTKLAELTHRNILSAAAALHTHLPAPNASRPTTVATRWDGSDALAVLGALVPGIGRATVYAMLSVGGSVSVRDASAASFDELKTSRPTVLVVTSAALKARLVGVKSRVGGYMGGHILSSGLRHRACELKAGRLPRPGSAIVDRFGMDEFRTEVGGRVKCVVLAGKAAAEDAEWFRCVLGCQVLAGHGWDETVGVGFLTGVGDYVGASASGWAKSGVPLPCLEAKLLDKEEFKASDEPDPRGEVCVRGNVVMRGYRGARGTTGEGVDDDGWFHTGEIGVLNADGTFSVLGNLEEARLIAARMDREGKEKKDS
ncbi:Long chain acyl-CoA synthetase 7 peroxisomal [Irineochytrium annulatum]|nr:Long chain acyl-CoA synthetase 7 peroxisomal [Irineochytrium annulatum]